LKKWLSLAAIVVLCLALVMGVACGGGGEKEEGVTEIKFGIGLPLTGIYGAFAGIPAKRGFELANDMIGEFTVGGESYEWELIFEDNGFTSAGGLASTNKFVYNDNVDFVFQSTADPGFASIPITEELGMILDIAAGGPFDYGPDTPHTFQTLNSWHLGIAPLFDWLTEEHPEVKHVAASLVEGQIGAAILDAAESCCDYYGLDLESETHPMASVEYYPIATRIMSYHPDLVIGITPLFEVLWEMGYEGLCACYHWTESTWGTVDTDDATGMLIFMPHPIGDMWPEVALLAAEYEEAYGEEFTSASLQTITLLYAYTDILRQAGTVDDIDKIIETMETGTFDTPIGPMYYGCEALNGIGHVAIWPAPIYEIVGEGEYQVVEIYSPEEAEALAEEVYAEMK